MALVLDAVRVAEVAARAGMVATRVAGGAVARSAAQPGAGKVDVDSEAGRNSGVIGVVIFAFTLPFAIAILVSGYQGHVTLKECVEFLVAGWSVMAVIGLGMWGADKLYTRAVLRHYAAPPPGDTETADMRAYLASLREQEEPPPPPLLWPGEGDEAERSRRVAALFSVPCPERTCRATAGVACIMGIAIPVSLVKFRPVTFCHHLRMRDAVRYGSATRDDVSAQFNGKTPSWIA